MDLDIFCRVSCFICLLLAQQNIMGVYSANYYRELLDKLFDPTNDYYKVIRPVKDSSFPVNVSMQLVLTDITAVEEINHQIELNVWVRQAWKDGFLTWNETEFGGKKQVVIPAEFIWIPDLTLYNGVGDSNDLKAEGAKVTVSSDGSIRWSIKATLRSACQMRLISFPFDRQECILRFGSWTYDGTLVNLDILGGDAGFDAHSEYHPNSEWDLMSAIAYREEIAYIIPSSSNASGIASSDVLIWPEAFFALQLKRKFTFYLFTLLVPYFIISSLSGLVFYLQPESGEKMGLAVTTLLSLVVFNEYVMSIVPPSADFFPLLTEYFTIMICWVGMCVLISTWILHIHHQDPKYCSRMGPRLRVLIFVYMARVVGGCGQTKRNDSTSAENSNRNKSVVKIHTYNVGFPEERSPPENEIDSSKVTAINIAGVRSLSSLDSGMDSSEITTTDIAGEQSPSAPEDEMVSTKVTTTNTDGRGMLESDVHKIKQLLLTKEEEEKKNEEDEAPLQEWRDAAKIVDQFFFGLYNGVNIFLVLVFTLKSLTASYHIEHDF